MSSGKLSRFGAWNSEMGLWQLGGSSDSEMFFAGQRAYDRMAEVRRAISYIRLNWDRYEQFMDELRGFLATVREPEPITRFEAEWKVEREKGRARVEALLASRKEWPELGEGVADDYSAVQLYTSPYGYLRMFAAMNEAFRRRNLIENPEMLRSVTFLVELLNIDLYRYIRSDPDVDKFEGRVYRGMRVDDRRFTEFTATAARDMRNRYMAVPLSMTSTSASRDSALEFAKRTGDASDAPHALLLDVSVYSAAPQLLAAYRQSFPASIVTSLCSVPIQRIADIPAEGEVLLRGPHFQIMRMYRDEDSLPGEPLNVIQMIMLNSNRDHVTAIATDTDEDKRMRDIFRFMAIASRSARCAEQAESYGLPADADYYRKSATRATRDFWTTLLCSLARTSQKLTPKTVASPYGLLPCGARQLACGPRLTSSRSRPPSVLPTSS
jgi:hypothetical protein